MILFKNFKKNYLPAYIESVPQLPLPSLLPALEDDVEDEDDDDGQDDDDSCTKAQYIFYLGIQDIQDIFQLAW